MNGSATRQVADSDKTEVQGLLSAMMGKRVAVVGDAMLRHVNLLERSRQQGDVLVGINTDASVKRLKGSIRPIQGRSDRVAAQACVDDVVFVVW